MNQPVVAITGASGFIGQALVRHLGAQGWAVRSISRQNALADSKTDVWARALDGAQAVVHLAAKAHQVNARVRQDDQRFDDNLALTSALLRACVQTSVRRLVFVSSIGVNGVRTNGQPFTEQDVPAPAEAYARSKWQCEQHIRQVSSDSGLQHVIVRPPLVYGPQAPGNFGRLVRAVERGWPLPLGAVHNRRHFAGLDNLVDALALCLTHPDVVQKTFLLADEEEVSTTDFLRLTAQAMGRSARLWPLPMPALRTAARLLGHGDAMARLCDSLQVNSQVFRQCTGWQQPWTLAQGLERAMQPLTPFSAP